MKSNYQQRKNRSNLPLFSISKFRAQLGYLPKALDLVWKAAPGWTLVSTILLIVQAVLPVASVYLTREVVNAFVLVSAGSAQPAALSAAVASGGLLGIVLLASAVLGSLQSYVRLAQSEYTQDYLTQLIHAKAVSLDVQYYESPDYYDQLQRASIDAISQPLGVVDGLNSLLQGLITMLGMGGLLLTYAWWLPLALVAGSLPALWATVHTNQVFQVWRKKNTLNQRRLAYYNRILVSEQAVAEVRLFDLGGYFRKAYLQLRKKLRQERLQLSRRQMIVQLAANLLGLLSMGLVLVWMAWRALQGFFNIGDLALFWQVLNQGQRQAQGLLSGAGDLFSRVYFLEDLFEFLQLQPKIQDPAEPVSPARQPGLRQALEVQNVTFHYPDSTEPALLNFSLSIPAGKIVAIVGENGAGKSTLIKLLCRFYDPQQGRITWDGVDLKQMAAADLRQRITVLFQQPVPYHETAFDNIRLGDLASNPQMAQVEQAARAGSADTIIAKLPQGYETVLGKWFGFTELSVGEWQRMALARAFVRQADLVILDEPTSAMDSWAENEWMGRFRELVQGKTALIITHRFSTAMQADIIHVMNEGHIVESGTHAELVALGERYSSSWRAQMRKITEE